MGSRKWSEGARNGVAVAVSAGVVVHLLLLREPAAARLAVWGASVCAVGVLAMVWSLRWHLAYGIAHLAWRSALGSWRLWALWRWRWRTWRRHDPPRGVCLHLADGRDILLEPRLAAVERGGARVWTLINTNPVRIGPNELCGARVQADYLPLRCKLVLNASPVQGAPEYYRFTEQPC